MFAVHRQSTWKKDPTEYNPFTSTFFNKSRCRYFKGNWFLFALNLLPWGANQQITLTWTLNKVCIIFFRVVLKGGPVDTIWNKKEITCESICICWMVSHISEDLFSSPPSNHLCWERGLGIKLEIEMKAKWNLPKNAFGWFGKISHFHFSLRKSFGCRCTSARMCYIKTEKYGIDSRKEKKIGKNPSIYDATRWWCLAWDAGGSSGAAKAIEI